MNSVRAAHSLPRAPLPADRALAASPRIDRLSFASRLRVVARRALYGLAALIPLVHLAPASAGALSAPFIIRVDFSSGTGSGNGGGGGNIPGGGTIPGTGGTGSNTGSSSAASTGFCVRNEVPGAFGATLTVVCRTGAFVEISSRSPGVSVSPVHGGAYRYLVQVAQGDLVLGTVDADVGLGTAAYWRVLDSKDRSYVEMGIAW